MKGMNTIKLACVGLLITLAVLAYGEQPTYQSLTSAIDFAATVRTQLVLVPTEQGRHHRYRRGLLKSTGKGLKRTIYGIGNLLSKAVHKARTLAPTILSAGGAAVSATCINQQLKPFLAGHALVFTTGASGAFSGWVLSTVLSALILPNKRTKSGSNYTSQSHANGGYAATADLAFRIPAPAAPPSSCGGACCSGGAAASLVSESATTASVYSVAAASAQDATGPATAKGVTNRVSAAWNRVVSCVPKWPKVSQSVQNVEETPDTTIAPSTASCCMSCHAYPVSLPQEMEGGIFVGEQVTTRDRADKAGHFHSGAESKTEVSYESEPESDSE